jgi:hypothetical protein
MGNTAIIGIPCPRLRRKEQESQCSFAWELGDPSGPRNLLTDTGRFATRSAITAAHRADRGTILHIHFLSFPSRYCVPQHLVVQRAGHQNPGRFRAPRDSEAASNHGIRFCTSVRLTSLAARRMAGPSAIFVRSRCRVYLITMLGTVRGIVCQNQAVMWAGKSQLMMVSPS